MRVLVTGGTGFIGVNLVHELLEKGHEPVVLTRDSSPTQYLPPGVETQNGDITDQQSLNKVFHSESFDAVAHLAMAAGRSNTASIGGDFTWETAKRINVEGSDNVFKAADQAGVSTVAFTSTVQAHPDVPQQDDAHYIRSKIKAEERLIDGDYSFSHTIVYPTNVIGPNDYRLRNYQPFQLTYANPVLIPPLYIPRTENFVHMDNVTSTLVHGIESCTSSRYLITGENITYKKYQRLIASVSNTRCHVISVPFYKHLIPWAMDRLYNRRWVPISGDVFDWDDSGDLPKRFQNQKPFDTKSLEQAIKSTHDWYVDVGVL